MKFIKKRLLLLISLFFLQNIYTTDTNINIKINSENNKKAKGIISSLYNYGSSIVDSIIDITILKPASVAIGITTGIGTGIATSCLTNEVIIKILQSKQTKAITNEVKNIGKSGIDFTVKEYSNPDFQKKYNKLNKATQEKYDTLKKITKTKTFKKNCNQYFTPTHIAASIVRPLIIHNGRQYIIDKFIFGGLNRLGLPVNKSAHIWAATITDWLISTGAIQKTQEIVNDLHDDYNTMTSN